MPWNVEQVRSSNGKNKTRARNFYLISEMTFTVYILKCRDTSLYVGSTNNIEKRLYAHNNLKSGAHYTKLRRPVHLIYSEKYATLREARQREHAIKQFTREKKIELIGGAAILT